jgi:predicted ABC-type ATPase
VTMKEKNIYIIAGCNGAGKTTASFTILPDVLNCKEFVNADEIARGLSPFQPEKVAIDAGKIMLNRINELLGKNENFAFETTLASKSYRSKVIEAQKKGYTVSLLYFWLNSIDLAKERVKNRVLEGGHNIEPAVIERRYLNGIINLFDIYLPIVDKAFIFDNSEGTSVLIAEQIEFNNFKIINYEKYEQFKNYYTNRSR